MKESCPLDYDELVPIGTEFNEDYDSVLLNG
jgi:hypothetical protein